MTTGRGDVAERARLLRNYGSRVKYVNDVIGFNSRLDELQAAVLRVKLPHLLVWNERRRVIAERYRRDLDDLPLELPQGGPAEAHVWHLFVVRSPERDRLQEHLAARGVDTQMHYPIPPHRQAAYAYLEIEEGTLPISEAIHRECLSLPIGPHLRPEQVDEVIDAVRSFDFGGTR